MTRLEWAPDEIHLIKQECHILNQLSILLLLHENENYRRHHREHQEQKIALKHRGRRRHCLQRTRHYQKLVPRKEPSHQIPGTWSYFQIHETAADSIQKTYQPSSSLEHRWKDSIPVRTSRNAWYPDQTPIDEHTSWLPQSALWKRGRVKIKWSGTHPCLSWRMKRTS